MCNKFWHKFVFLPFENISIRTQYSFCIMTAKTLFKKTQPAVLDLMLLTRSSRLVRLPSRMYTGLRLLLRVRIRRGWLVCRVSSTYMLEVERRECPTEFKWDNLYLYWKLGGGNVVPNRNYIEVESYANGVSVTHNSHVMVL